MVLLVALLLHLIMWATKLISGNSKYGHPWDCIISLVTTELGW